MSNINYEEKDINEFLELAQEIGITGARRELGFPKSWATGKKWADARNININVDEIKARAAATREWYKEEEIKLTAQEGLNRIYNEWVNNRTLSADDMKKLSASFKDIYGVWANVQGKATNINETRNSSFNDWDNEFEKLFNAERDKNNQEHTESM